MLNLLGIRTVQSFRINCSFKNSTTILAVYRGYSNKKQVNEEKLNFQEYINQMQVEINTSKRINANNLKESIKLVDKKSGSSGILFLLDSVRFLPDHNSEERLKLFNEIWDAGSLSVCYDETHYKKLLQIYKNNKEPIENHLKFLADLKFSPSPSFYQDLLDLTCEFGNTPNMQKLLTDMKKRNIQLNEEIFNSLIRGHSRNKDLKGVLEVLDSMNAADIQRSTQTDTELIRAYVENNDVNNAKKLISEKGTFLSESQLISILESTIYYSDERSIVPMILKNLPEETFNNTQIDSGIRNFLVELVYAKKFADIIIILDKLPKPEFKINENDDRYGAFLIHEMILANHPIEVVLELTNFLVKSERNLRALHVTTEVSLQKNSLHSIELLKLLAKTEPLRPHYFWPLLIKQFDVAGEQGVLGVIKCMSELNVVADQETINAHILSKLSLTLKNVKQSMKIFESNGLKPSQIITPLISHLMYQHRFDDINNLNSSYQSTRIDTELLIWPLIMVTVANKSDINLVNVVKLIKSFNNKALNTSYDLAGLLMMELVSSNKMRNEHKTILKLLAEYNTFDVKISQIASDVLLSHFVKCGEDEAEIEQKYLKAVTDKKLSLPAVEFSGTQMIHPRDMNFDELECHLAELQNKKLNFRGVLRRLLGVCVREGKLERAVQVKKLCDENRVDLSPGMMASIFDLHIRLKHPIDAEKTFKQMRKQFPGFLLDEHKLIDYATLLVECNQLKDAKIILKERSQESKVRGGNHIQKNLWNLLSMVANNQSASDKNETKELFQLLVELKFCTTQTNTLFGPIIRESLLKNQLKEAIAEFLDICKKYRKTPLQLELIKLLVEQANKTVNESTISPEEAQQYLQLMLKAGSKIHGVSKTNTLLVIAIAEVGTENQLRKVLLDQNFQLDPDHLLSQCEFLGDSGKLGVLLKLGRSVRGLEHHIKVNESQLYKLILDVLVRKNDVESAVNLFDHLVNEGECKITQEFSRDILNLLQRNKLEIPYNVAIYSK